MSLKEKLDQIRAGAAKRIPADKLAVMHAVTTRQQASGLADRAISVGATLPSFELANQHGDPVRSADLLATGPLVLTIYRGVW